MSTERPPVTNIIFGTGRGRVAQPFGFALTDPSVRLSRTRLPKQQWKNIRTTNVIERLNGEFRRRVKTQGSLPSEDAALVLLFGLIATGQIKLRKIDGYPQLLK